MSRGRLSGGMRRFRFAGFPGTLIVVLTVFMSALAALSVPVHAHGYKLGHIAVGHVWAPPPAPGATGMAVFGPLLNEGKATARLMGASTPIARRVRIRIDRAGKTRWPASLELRPGRPLSLAPWREHLWLSGLTKRPRAGESFDLTLDFGKSGKLTVKVVVQKSAAH